MLLFLNILNSIKSFILIYWKQFILTCLILCSIVSIYIAVSEHKSKLIAEDKLKTYGQTERTATTIIKRYTDSTGASHTQINNDENKIKQNEIIKGKSIKPSIIDTTAQVLKIAKDRIVELTKINSQLIAENLKAHSETKEGITRYVYRDKYADMSFNPIDSTFGLKYNLSLITTKYIQSTGFLKLGRINILDLSSPDPRVTIQGVQHYLVQQEDPDFGFKLQVKGQYNVRTHDFTPAIVGELNYKRLSLEGNYFYNLSNGQKTPTISLKGDLIRF